MLRRSPRLTYFLKYTYINIITYQQYLDNFLHNKENTKLNNNCSFSTKTIPYLNYKKRNPSQTNKKIATISPILLNTTTVKQSEAIKKENNKKKKSNRQAKQSGTKKPRIFVIKND